MSKDEIQTKLEQFLEDLKLRWDSANIFGKNWIFLNYKQIANSIAFMLDCLDELIQFVENLFPEGSLKKAAVISVLSKLYDYTIGRCLPIWAQPFSMAIKQIVLIAFSLLIDFIVRKYNSGIWRKDA